MSDAGSDTRRRSRRILLVLSLTFNVFFVGTLVGGSFVGHSMHKRTEGIRHAPPIHSFASPRKILREAEPEERKKMLKVVRKEMKEIKPLLKAVGQERRNVIDALGADSLDESAALEAMKSLVEAETKAHGASNQTVVHMLAVTSDAERQRIMEELKSKRRDRRERRHSRHGDGRWSKDDKPPPPDPED